MSHPFCSITIQGQAVCVTSQTGSNKALSFSNKAFCLFSKIFLFSVHKVILFHCYELQISENISTRRTTECFISFFPPVFMRVLVVFQSAITTVFAAHHSTRAPNNDTWTLGSKGLKIAIQPHLFGLDVQFLKSFSSWDRMRTPPP